VLFKKDFGKVFKFSNFCLFILLAGACQNDEADDGLVQVFEKMDFSEGAYNLRKKQCKSLSFLYSQTQLLSPRKNDYSPSKQKNSFIE